MTIKDKRLQIRVTEQELEGIGQRAKAAGLSVAEYGRSRLLAADGAILTTQETLGIEDPGLSREEILAPEDPGDVAARRQAMQEAGFPASDWQPKIPDRDGPNYVKTECDVEGVPLGVRCIKCGKVHGS